MIIQIDDTDVERIATKVCSMLAGVVPAGSGKQVDNESILDIDGLCLLLGMSKKWVYDRIAEKSLPHFKLGHVLKFRKKEVEKWLRLFDVPAVRPATAIKRLITIK